MTLEEKRRRNIEAQKRYAATPNGAMNIKRRAEERRRRLLSAALCVACGQRPVYRRGGLHCSVCHAKRRGYPSYLKLMQRGAAYYLAHREQRLAASRGYTRRLKAETFRVYGSICSCCGESLLEFLTLDHTAGATAWLDAPRGGKHLYQWLKLRGHPPGFQVLCLNCNFAKGHFGHCPHLDVSEVVGACEG